MSRFLTIAVAIGIAVVAGWSDRLLAGSPGMGPMQVLLFLVAALYLSLLWVPVEWRRRALLLTGSFLVAVLVTEIAINIAVPLTTRPYASHPRYLHALVPGAVGRFQRLPQNGGQNIEMHVNSQGFRGPELRADATPRLIVYGDSCIQSEYSEEENTFVAQLAQQLEPKFPEIEVVNAGVVSYGPDQELLRMEDELGPLKPDLVLVAFCSGNDYGDLIRNKLFRLDGNRLQQMPVTLAPELKARFIPDHPGLRTAELIRRALGRVRRRGRLPSEPDGPPPAYPIPDAIEVFRMRAAKEYEAYLEQPLVVTNLRYDCLDADLAVSPNAASARLKVALLRAVVARMQEVAAEYDVPLAFLVIPTAGAVCDYYEGEWVDPARYPEYDRERLTRTMVEIADSLAIPCFDLFRPFRDADAESLHFHGGDTHWNDAGQAVAAELTARFLLNDPRLLASGYERPRRGGGLR